MVELRTRTTTHPDGTKIIRFVVDTRPTRSKDKLSTTVEVSRRRAAKTDHNQPATQPMKHKAKSKAGAYTALVIVKPANPYLTGSRDKALEIAKRAGILNDAGKLMPRFRCTSNT